MFERLCVMKSNFRRIKNFRPNWHIFGVFQRMKNLYEEIIAKSCQKIQFFGQKTAKTGKILI